jgi:ABC-type polysaccharide/polyol phosphate transport system ATPase subunit
VPPNDDGGDSYEIKIIPKRRMDRKTNGFSAHEKTILLVTHNTTSYLKMCNKYKYLTNHSVLRL